MDQPAPKKGAFFAKSIFIELLISNIFYPLRKIDQIVGNLNFG